MIFKSYKPKAAAPPEASEILGRITTIARCGLLLQTEGRGLSVCVKTG